MLENSDVGRILAEKHIPIRVLNRFVDLLYQSGQKQFLSDPRVTMRKILSKARHFYKNYYLSGRFLFECDNNNIENVFLTPKLSAHAKRRLLERFKICGEDRFIRIVQEITAGRMLSHREKRRCDIDEHLIAIKFENRIYILSNNHELITVIEDKNT